MSTIFYVIKDEQRWMTRESALRSEVSRQMARAEEAESNLQLSKVEINNGALGGTTTEVGALLAQLATLQENSLEKDRRFQAKEKAFQQTAGINHNQIIKYKQLFSY